MSIAVNEGPKTFSKYVATVTPQTKDTWTILVEDVRYFTADPETVYARHDVYRQDNVKGTEEELRAEVCKVMKELIDDRDAMIAAKPFSVQEDELSG